MLEAPVQRRTLGRPELRLASVGAGLLFFASPPVAHQAARAQAQAETADIVYASTRGRGNDLFVTEPSPETKPRPLIRSGANEIAPSWAPGRSAAAFASNRGGGWHIYFLNRGTGVIRQLTRGRAADFAPAWSPRSDRIAFVRHRGRSFDLYLVKLNGAVTRLTRTSAQESNPAWSPRGTAIVYERISGRGSDLYTVDLRRRRIRRLTRTREPEFDPAWSPDGRRIAFTVLRNGNYDVYTSQATGKRRKRLTTDPAEDSEPSWAPDGTMLAFTSARTGDYDIFVTDLTGRSQFDISANSNASEIEPDWGGGSARVLDMPASSKLRSLASGGFACTTPAPDSSAHHLFGGSLGDVLCGTPAVDTIEGRGGNDTLFGDSGRDKLLGGPGADTIYSKGDGADDKVRGGSANADSARIDKTRDNQKGIEAFL